MMNLDDYENVGVVLNGFFYLELKRQYIMVDRFSALGFAYWISFGRYMA